MSEADLLMDDVYDLIAGNEFNVGIDFKNSNEVSDMFLSFDAKDPMIYFTVVSSGKKYALILTEVGT
jgi:hypothetical protein